VANPDLRDLKDHRGLSDHLAAHQGQLDLKDHQGIKDQSDLKDQPD
jgi:hypothetical protein